MSEESSGFFTATIPASSHGAYSAKLLLDGGSYPFSGTFDLSGNAEANCDPLRQTPAHGDLQLDDTTDQMTGSVSDNATNAWISELQADRAVFNAKSNPATDYTGKYTLVIPPGSNAPTNEPGGYGYATLANTPGGAGYPQRLPGRQHRLQPIRPGCHRWNHPSLRLALLQAEARLQGWLTLTNYTNHLAQTILGASLAWIKPRPQNCTPRLYQHQHHRARLALHSAAGRFERLKFDQRHPHHRQWRAGGSVDLQQPYNRDR